MQFGQYLLIKIHQTYTDIIFIAATLKPLVEAPKDQQNTLKLSSGFQFC